jgi:hypothetical protein
MKHLTIRRNVLKLLWLLQSEEQQEKYYDTKKAAIKSLSMQEWFNHIIQYREIEADSALQALRNRSTPVDEIRYWQAKYDQALWFLDYVENMKL